MARYQRSGDIHSVGLAGGIHLWLGLKADGLPSGLWFSGPRADDGAVMVGSGPDHRIAWDVSDVVDQMREEGASAGDVDTVVRVTAAVIPAMRAAVQDIANDWLRVGYKRVIEKLEAEVAALEVSSARDLDGPTG